MKISRLKIQGFRTIEGGFDCDFKDLTIFVGPNNSGKSAVVRALDIFFNNNEKPADLKAHTRINPKATALKKRYTMLITLWFRELPEHLSKKYTEYINSDDLLPVRFCYKPTDETISYLIFKEGKLKDAIKSGEKSSTIYRDITDNLLLRIIPETRDVQREFRTELGQAFGKLKEIIIENAHGKAAKTARTLQALVHSIFDKELTHRINEHLGEVIHEHHFKIGSLAEDIFVKTILEQVLKQYPMRAKSADGEFPLEQMGAGFQSNVLIALYRAVANISKRKLILCVEEPEIHLDPHAQRQTYYEWSKLSAEENDVDQIIITSHSAFLVNEAKPEEIVVVKRNKENNTVVSQLSQSELENHRPIHLKTKILGIKNSDIFFSTGVILVEGDSDAVALRGCFEKILMDKPIKKRNTLSALGISVIDCGGKDSIPPLARIIRALEIPFVMIFDKDFLQKSKEESRQIEKEYEKEFDAKFKKAADFFENPEVTNKAILKKMTKGKQQGYPIAINAILKKSNMLIIRTEHETDFIDEDTAKYVSETVSYKIPAGEDISTTIQNLKRDHKNALGATGTAMVLDMIPNSACLPKIYRQLCADVVKVLGIKRVPQIKTKKIRAKENKIISDL